MFWNMCGVSVNGAIPTHCAPSPPMWVTPESPTLGQGQHHAVAADAGTGHGALGDDRRAIVRTARAEERLARDGQRRRPLAQRFQQGHPRRDGAELDLALETGGDDLGDAIGVQLAVGGHQGAVVEVALADDHGRSVRL